MTIKKIGLSAIAIATISTAAFATGSLSLNGVVGKFSNELITNTSVDVNNTSPLNYTCGITNASASEPGFELKLASPAVIKSSDGNISILAVDDNSTIAVFDRYDSSAHSIIFKKNAGASISRGVAYKVVSDDNTTLGTGSMEITVTKGSSAVNAQLIVTDNTGVTVIDDVSAKILEGADQFSMSIDHKFDAQIDASKAFKEFYVGASATDDIVNYTMANNKALFNIPATATKIQLDIVADQNLTTYKVTNSANTGGAQINTYALSDYNLTASAGAPDNNFSETIASTLTTDKTGAMVVTNFKATGVVGFNGFSKTLLSAVDAGAWTIYGYNAQIPNVASTSIVDVAMKFTNRSTLDTDIYFTLIDPDGTTATLNSVDNPSLAKLPANTTGTYKASALVALLGDAVITETATSTAGFNSTGSFSVEVSIPTTPSSVYGMASFKNTNLGQFKDLPVYNSSEMAY